MNSTDKQEEEVALSVGATMTLCIETEEDGWREGKVFHIGSFPKTNGEIRHMIKSVFKHLKLRIQSMGILWEDTNQRYS